MAPEVREYADPFEGLTVQLTELRGLIRTVPPLIEADRQRRWDEIKERPADGEEDDVVETYGTEAGAEEGWGFADFGRTIRVAAVVFGWAIFHDYLARELKENFLDYDLDGFPALEKLVEEDARSWDRRFDQLKDRYRDFADISLAGLPSWEQVLHAQALRNALVHNQGQYTRAYLRTNLARRPTEEDLLGAPPPAGDAGLIDHEVIPLSLSLADEVMAQLITAATEVHEAIEEATQE